MLASEESSLPLEDGGVASDLEESNASSSTVSSPMDTTSGHEESLLRAVSCDSKKRPLSISSMSSSSSSSLPRQNRYKRRTPLDFHLSENESDRTSACTEANISLENLTDQEEQPTELSENDDNNPLENPNIIDVDISTEQFCQVPTSPVVSYPSHKSSPYHDSPTSQNSILSHNSLPSDHTPPSVITPSSQYSQDSRHIYESLDFQDKESPSNANTSTPQTKVLTPPNGVCMPNILKFSEQNEAAQRTVDQPLYVSKHVVNLSSQSPKSPTRVSSPKSPTSPGHQKSKPSPPTTLPKPQKVLSYVQRIVTEILDTERTYVKNLHEIITGYMEYDDVDGSEHVIQDVDKAVLFGNLEDIYEFSRNFLAELEKCGTDPVKVSNCFYGKRKGFKIYADYCTNYPNAVETLTRFMGNREQAEFFKQRQMHLGHGLPLGAYLLKPVQRILKYHLIFQNMVKHMNEEDPCYELVVQTLTHMTDMAHYINEMKRKHEHAVRVQEIQSQLEEYDGEDLTTLGEFVTEGVFRMTGARGYRLVVLFQKAVLIAKKKEEGMLSCKAFIKCSNLTLMESILKEPLSFQIIDNKSQFTFQARTQEQKRQWCQQIKRLIVESYEGKIPEKVMALVMGLGRKDDDADIENNDPSRRHQALNEINDGRRVRRKSGNLIPDFNLLKPPKSKKGNRKVESVSPRGSPPPDPPPLPPKAKEILEARALKKLSASSGNAANANQSPTGKISNACNGHAPRNMGSPIPLSCSVPNGLDSSDTDLSPSKNPIYTSPPCHHRLLSTKAVATNMVRAPSFYMATKLHPMGSEDFATENLKQPEKMEVDDKQMNLYKDHGDYVDLVFHDHSDLDDNGLYSNVFETPRVLSMPHLVDDYGDYVHVYENCQSMEMVDALVKSEQSKSALVLTPDSASAQELVTDTHREKGIKISKAPPSNSSYLHRQKRVQPAHKTESPHYMEMKCGPNAFGNWKGSTENMLAKSQKPPLPSKTNAKRNSYTLNSPPKSSVSVNSDLMNSSSSDLDTSREDPWVRLTDSRQESPNKLSQRSPRHSFPCDNRFTGRYNARSTSTALSQEYLDWMVYSNRTASPTKEQNRNSHHFTPSPKGTNVTLRNPSHQPYSTQQKLAISHYATPPRTLMDQYQTYMNISEADQQKHSTENAATLSKREISDQVVAGTQSDRPQLLRSNSASAADRPLLHDVKKPLMARHLSLNMDDVKESEQMVEEMEAYLKNSPKKLKASLSSKFPVLTESEPMDTESLATNQTCLKKNSMTGASVYLPNGEQISEGVVGSIKNKWSNLTARFWKNTSPGPSPRNSRPSSRNSSTTDLHHHSTASLKQIDKPSPSSKDKKSAGGMVSQLARLYTAKMRNSDNTTSNAFQRNSSIRDQDISLGAILKEGEPGSSTIGSRMALIKPIELSPYMSNPKRPPRPKSDPKLSSISLPSPINTQSPTTDTNPVVSDNSTQESLSVDIQQSDSGFSIHSDIEELISPCSSHMESKSDSLFKSECGSDSADSFYEHKLSEVLDENNDVFRDSAIYCETDYEHVQDHSTPRVSIRKYVQILEEKNRPQQKSLVDVRRKEPSCVIKQRLQNLQEKSQYKKINLGTLKKNDHLSKSVRDIRCNLVHSVSTVKTDPPKIDWDNIKNQNISTNVGASTLKTARSLGNLDQMRGDTDSLVTMRGWVRQLITKFQTVQ